MSDDRDYLPDGSSIPPYEEVVTINKYDFDNAVRDAILWRKQQMTVGDGWMSIKTSWYKELLKANATDKPAAPQPSEPNSVLVTSEATTAGGVPSGDTPFEIKTVNDPLGRTMAWQPQPDRLAAPPTEAEAFKHFLGAEEWTRDEIDFTQQAFAAGALWQRKQFEAKLAAFKALAEKWREYANSPTAIGISHMAFPVMNAMRDQALRCADELSALIAQEEGGSK